jgi:uncharacterized NAD(P)/FAD-binding protein YdhS
MIYTQHGDWVSLEMTRSDFDQLMLMLGCACGSVHIPQNPQMFYSWLRFTNELNNNNPNFTPYEIPAEYLKEEGHNPRLGGEKHE